MSDVNNEDEEFKLPLRPWLKNHIDKKTFEGLEWIDAKAQIFKIPWTKKNHPGWEKDYEVFKCWAKHRGRLDSEPLDYNKLKGNFRSVLHKSEDFKELKEKSKTDKQTGNYRVFQILTSSAVKENRKRTRRKSEEAVSSQAIPKQKKPSEFDQTPGPSDSPQPPERDLSRQAIVQKTAPESSQPCGDFMLSLEPSSSPNFSMACSIDFPPTLPLPSETSYTTMIMDNSLPAIPLSDVQLFLTTDVQNCLSPLGVASHGAEPSTKADAPGADKCVADDAPFEQDNKKPPLRLLQFLKKLNLSEKELTQYMLTVHYGEKIVVCQKRFDFLGGLRVLYGDPVSQMNAAVANGKIVKDFKAKTFELPKFKRDNRHIKEILSLAKLGFVLSSTSDGTLYVKRLCQSRLYFSKDKTRSVKIERKEKVEIFSYLKYIEYLSHNAGALSDGKVELFLGEKPPTPIMNVVKFTLQPVLTPPIEYFFVKEKSFSTSLCFSEEPSSVEKMITLFTNQSLQD